MTKERKEMFIEYLRKWDFALMPLMPIAEEEAEYLIELFDRMEREAAQKHDYYMKNQDKYIQKANESYERKKAQAFIKRGIKV